MDSFAAPCVTDDETVLTLESKEGEQVETKAKFAFMSKHIKTMIEDTGPEDVVPIPNVRTEVLKKVLDYCEHHHNQPAKEIEKPLKSPDLSEVASAWDVQYVDVEKEMLIDLVHASNYLDIPSLLDLCCSKIASLIQGKTTEEIRKIFDITNDFTPEEEAKVRDENRWCEES